MKARQSGSAAAAGDGAATRRPQYTALIRTFDSAATLPATLRSLGRQDWPPARCVFVDSGSSDATLALLPAGAIVHRYVGADFNYADAIHQGLGHVETEFVLIISSHLSLGAADATRCALTLLREKPAFGAAYFCNDAGSCADHTVIDAGNFDGFNGLWNNCALVRTALLRKRGFRPEVFAAEDQEWAHWLFTEQGMRVARIAGARVVDANPRRRSMRKRLNEYTAIAFYANRRLLGAEHLARVAFCTVKPRVRGSDRVFYLRLFFRLLACHWRPPSARSRYYRPNSERANRGGAPAAQVDGDRAKDAQAHRGRLFGAGR